MASKHSERHIASDDEAWKHSISKRTKRLETIIHFLVLLLVLLCSFLLYCYDSLNIDSFDLHKLQQTVSTLDGAHQTHSRKSAQFNARIANLEERIHSFDEKLQQHDNINVEKTPSQIVDLSKGERNKEQPMEYVKKIAKKKESFFTASTLFNKPDYVNDNTNHHRNLQTNPDANMNLTNICDTLKPILSPLDAANNFTYSEEIRKKLSIIYGLSTLESLNNQKSPQYKAACWLLWDDPSKLKADDTRLIERYALSTFFYTQNKEGINPPSDICGSIDITCNNMGHMTKFDLGHAGLEGFLPSEFFNMLDLEHLNLEGNFFTGTIPPTIGNTMHLQTLNFEGNNLRGAIPSEIGQLSRLQELKLNSNQISGNIPTEISNLTELTTLELQQNRLTGSIPSHVLACTKLSMINVEGNQLSGTIPTNFEHMQVLKAITLSRNKLVGTIPSEIGLVTSLKELWLRDNLLSGTVPREIGTLTNISRIILEENRLTGNLDGIFDNFTSLWGINLGSNKFTGKIPDSLWDIDISQGVILEGNSLTGTVPDDYCAQTTILKLDNSVWLQEPEVECSCCTVKNCHMWDIGIATERPVCPSSNVYDINFFMSYRIEDLIMNQTLVDLVGPGIPAQKPICLSPTGCYSIENRTNIMGNDGMTEQYFLQYSNESKSLDIQIECDAVTICDNVYGPNHPKREGINHLTQVVFPDMNIDKEDPEYLALCFLLEMDQLYHEFDVCDGTLLQRYVLGLFFFIQGIADRGFALDHTCDWPGLTCDEDRKYVEFINMSDQGLNGNLNSELGLLTKLRRINLSNNNLKGTLDPLTFSSLPFLEAFNVGGNDMSGEIPDLLYKLPELKKLNLSSNMFHGSLPDDIAYSQNLETIDLGNNLLQGKISKSLLACKELKYADLSQNTFSDLVPSQLGELKDLTVLKLNKNRLRGSIPVEIFNSHNIKELMLQSNLLTGSIPTQVGSLSNLTKISMSYNSLKGNIPSEMGLLTGLELVQFHHNSLSGTAPKIEGFTEENSYITDCGVPSFLLKSRITCPTCTMCCNSLKQCQKTLNQQVSVWVMSFVIFLVVVPSGFVLLIFAGSWLQRKGYIRLPSIKRSSLSIYNEDSVYCLIFSKDRWALLIYFTVAIIQALLFVSFLNTSDINNEATDWEYTFRCPDNSLECNNGSDTTKWGWTLFCIVTIIFLGSDFVDSIFQLAAAVKTFDLVFFISGTIRMLLCLLALYTSIQYNQALGTTNTQLITNTVILLFINDIDEKCLLVLQSIFPSWVAKRYVEIQENLSNTYVDDIKENESNKRSVLDRRLGSHRFIGASFVSRRDIYNDIDEEESAEQR